MSAPRIRVERPCYVFDWGQQYPGVASALVYEVADFDYLDAYVVTFEAGHIPPHLGTLPAGKTSLSVGGVSKRIITWRVGTRVDMGE